MDRELKDDYDCQWKRDVDFLIAYIERYGSLEPPPDKVFSLAGKSTEAQTTHLSSQNLKEFGLSDSDSENNFISTHHDYGRGTNDQKRRKIFSFEERRVVCWWNSKRDLVENVLSILGKDVTPRRLLEQIIYSYLGEELFLHQQDNPEIIVDPIYVAKRDSIFSRDLRRRIVSTMSTSSDAQLFEDNFTITQIDALKYDRVARLTCNSADNETFMTLDINTELYPCAVGETLHVVMATTLSLDGSKEEKGWRDVIKNGAGGETTLADMYDYVCHGKLYKFDDDQAAGEMYVYPHESEYLANLPCSRAFISFGGLLCAMNGTFKKLSPLRVDYIYLLIKK